MIQMKHHQEQWFFISITDRYVFSQPVRCLIPIHNHQRCLFLLPLRQQSVICFRRILQHNLNSISNSIQPAYVIITKWLYVWDKKRRPRYFGISSDKTWYWLLVCYLLTNVKYIHFLFKPFSPFSKCMRFRYDSG